MKKTSILLICTIFSLVSYARVTPPIIGPIHIMNASRRKHGGNIEFAELLALYLAINTMIILAMVVRGYIIRNHEYASRQSLISRFVHELPYSDYDKKNYFNLLFIGLLGINALAILGALTHIFYKLIS